MIESDADRLASIQALDGQLISYADGSFWAIFDREFLLIDGSVESRQPTLQARTSDVSDIQKDTIISVPGEEAFRVKRHEPDGSGMTLLILKR